MSGDQGEGVSGLPGGMPTLGAGRHSDPQQGACLMEYTALLVGERFSDHPRCTHPALAALARQVNDRLSSSARPELVTRAPALAAIGPHTPGVAAAAAGAACEFAMREVLSPAAARRLRGRLARLQARDRAGRSSGRHRNTVAASFLISAGLNSTRAIAAGPDRDRVLLGALDNALTALSEDAGEPIEEELPAMPLDRSPAT